MSTLVPDKGALRRYLAQGLTQSEIVERWQEESGIKVSRSAIGMAIERYGLESANPRKRHLDLIPWRVARIHNNKMDVQMLRAESRRRAGDKLPARTERILFNWLDRLEEANAVVYYNADTAEGFHWVHREEGDTDIVRAPSPSARRVG